MPRLIQHACFDCRRVFKKPAPQMYPDPHTMPPLQAYVCPKCGKTMTCMGTKFRAPKDSALKEWKLLADRVRAGLGWASGAPPIEIFVEYKERDAPAFINPSRSDFKPQ